MAESSTLIGLGRVHERELDSVQDVFADGFNHVGHVVSYSPRPVLVLWHSWHNGSMLVESYLSSGLARSFAMWWSSVATRLGLQLGSLCTERSPVGPNRRCGTATIAGRIHGCTLILATALLAGARLVPRPGGSRSILSRRDSGIRVGGMVALAVLA